jgi:hypothetical protein
MGASGMKALRQRAQEFAEAIGMAGAAGVALLVFAAAFAVATLAPAYEALHAAREREQRLAGRLSDAGGQRSPSGDDLEAQLAAFLKHFPAADDARQDILRLQGFAAKHGIELRRGEYRVAPESGTPLVRHQIALPVTGSYLSVRSFVAEALQQLPSVALTSVSLKRDSISSQEIEARLQFVLYTGS